MRITACGDALFSSRNLRERLDPKLLQRLRDADATFANAEFVCPGPMTAPMPRKYITSTGPHALDELRMIGVNLLSFANNHAGDFGSQGVIDTIEACEARDMLQAGIGRSLWDARKPCFRDTPKGRVALIATSTTRSAEMAASPPGHGLIARAGVNPLRWGRSYVLPEREFDQIRAIDALLKTDASRQEVSRVEVAPPVPDGRLFFGSFFEGSLQIERGETASVRYFRDERDARAILASIRDAASRSDIVLLSLHTHEGEDENWYAPRSAGFIEDFAREAIEAGASAVLGHGAHMLRGIEFHRGRPIFYSLNSLFMEFEAGEQLMSAEMYDGYGLGRDSLPSHLHSARAKNLEGDWIGFNADPRFSRSCIATCDFDNDSIRVSLLPLDLGLQRDRPHERGVPAIADTAMGQDIARELAAMSAVYGTKIAYDSLTGTITANA